MPAGRPVKVPPRYKPLWVQVQPVILTELDALADEIAVQSGAGINVTRQDAARAVFNAWLAARVAAQAKRGGAKRHAEAR